MLMGLVLAVVLLFPHQEATAGQPTVDLGSAGSFAILARTAITSTGVTTIEGNVGVSPAGDITGIEPGMVSGNIHKNDPIATQAAADLNTAIIDAAARTGATLHDGELGGDILPPGLYKSSPGLAFSITAKDLTLDAEGNPNAVWIFQMTETLILGSGVKVILINGAQARNIFWQVGSSATLGEACVLKGNILASTAITMNGGARLDGRALAHTAAVTLIANTITKKGLYSDQPWRILLMD
ncbi:MAG: ice-binding family protein [Deltaproteobacteria bacterium]|nr:ice-binding family protein [Deltaproteobacteria bacterium]